MRHRRRRLVAVAFAAGAATAYYYDPENGPARREKLREQCRSLIEESQPHVQRVREQSQSLIEQSQPLVQRVREQSQSLTQRVSESADKRRRSAATRRNGDQSRTKGSEQFHPESDVDLREHLHQVLAELEFPTTDVNVDVAYGAATLRGQLKSDTEIRAAIDAVQNVEGVERVESYLHLPGTPAPNKADALRAT